MKYLISGWNGFYNLGDDLLLISCLSSIKERDSLAFFYVFTDNKKATIDLIPEKLKKNTQVVERKKGKLSWRYQIFFYSLLSKWYIIPGGTALRDFNFPSDTILTHYKMSKIAYLAGCKVRFLGIGVGPIWKEESLIYLKKIFKFSQVSVRDKYSFNILKKLGVQNVKLSTDLLFSMRTDHFKKNKKLTTPKVIGLAFRNWDNSINNAEPKPLFTKKFDAIKKMSLIINKIEKVFPSAEIKFYCFQKSKVFLEDDISFAKSINRHMKKSFQINPLNLNANCNYCDIQKKLISVDYMIGVRLHALIISSILNIPVLAIEYDIKIRGLMENLNKASYIIKWDDIGSINLDPTIKSAYFHKTDIGKLYKISDSNFNFIY